MLLSIIQIDIGTHKIFRLYFGYISAIFYSEKTTDFRARPIDIFSIYILGTFLKVPDRLKTVDLVIFSLEILRLKFSVKLVVFSCNRSRNRWFRSSFLEIWSILYGKFTITSYMKEKTFLELKTKRIQTCVHRLKIDV